MEYEGKFYKYSRKWLHFSVSKSRPYVQPAIKHKYVEVQRPMFPLYKFLN